MFDYDFLLDLINIFLKNGVALSSLGMIVILILKQKKMKRRLRKYLPFMFQEDNDVQAYIGNQLLIMRNIEMIMNEMGIEPCERNGSTTKSWPQDQKSSNILSKLLPMGTAQANHPRRERKMKGLKKVIDAGHGGHDPGAQGPSGRKEKDFALTMALKVEQRLKRDKKVTPVLTRNKDTFVELKDRAKMANKQKVDGFISIHANSTGKVGSATGTETLYTREESKSLANIIHKHVAAATGLKDRGVKYQNIHVTRETTMPAVLLEIGFINHPEDEKKLFDPAFQDRVADAIVAGIYEYFGITVEAPAPPPAVPHKEMEITVHAGKLERYTGYNIKGKTWIPSQPIGELLGGRIVYKNGIVNINGTDVETQNIGGNGYVWSRDLKKLLGARIFWDKKEPNRVDIFKK
ncbi:N-acetylmuramoyl-L-alanine amidase family protein [Paenibacillus sp. DMB20]|uniref:N-acetylmuramoyl-L-alanine amidase family protein n=1 Tax=Paenibacillus sp. DMB20 TaxID=1642570 RepID=UPI0006997B6E|nr:N-acetylmuramoyl-L-alanine amidase [Paenibacillus sp. DMB20]